MPEGAPVDVFLVGLILVFTCNVGFGLFTVGFAAVGFAVVGLTGFRGAGVFKLLGLDVGLAMVGFGTEDFVVVFPGVGPLGLVGEGQTLAGFETVGFGVLGVLSVGLGVTEFRVLQDKGGPVWIKERDGGVAEEGLDLNPGTPSLTLTAEDPPGPLMDVQMKLVGVGVKVRLGVIV